MKNFFHTLSYTFILATVIESNKNALEKKVVKGKPTLEKQIRYIVSISENFTHKCGGTLVSPQHIVAVAHCFLDEILFEDPQYCNFRALVGTNCLQYGGDQYDIEHVKVHDLFMKSEATTAYDIAVAILQNPVELTEYVSVLPISKKEVTVGMESEVPGWGATNVFVTSEKAIKGAFLKLLEVEVVDAIECIKHMPMSKIHSYEFCLKPQNIFENLSLGDGGSPFVQDDTFAGMIVRGNTSILGSCSVAIDISNFRPFILRIIHTKPENLPNYVPVRTYMDEIMSRSQ